MDQQTNITRYRAAITPKNAINIGLYVLPVLPKGIKRTSLKPIGNNGLVGMVCRYGTDTKVNSVNI